MYDENGDAFGFNYNGNDYYYVRNAQNDIVFITDSANNGVVMYQYDAWGNITTCYDTSDDGMLSIINPYTYRGYYYEIDTATYFLKSRYYNPELCRFISADGMVNANQDVLGNNLYAYCSNDPVNCSDTIGCGKIKNFIKRVANSVSNFLKNTFGCENTVVAKSDISTTNINSLILSLKVKNSAEKNVKKIHTSNKPITFYKKKNILATKRKNSYGVKMTAKDKSSASFNLSLESLSITTSYENGNMSSTEGIVVSFSSLSVGYMSSISQTMDDGTVNTVSAIIDVNLFQAAVYALAPYLAPEAAPVWSSCFVPA